MRELGAGDGGPKRQSTVPASTVAEWSTSLTSRWSNDSSAAGGFLRKKMAQNTPPEFCDRRDWGAIEAWAKDRRRAAQSAGSGGPVGEMADVKLSTSRAELPAYLAIPGGSGPWPGSS